MYAFLDCRIANLVDITPLKATANFLRHSTKLEAIVKVENACGHVDCK